MYMYRSFNLFQLYKKCNNRMDIFHLLATLTGHMLSMKPWCWAAIIMTNARKKPKCLLLVITTLSRGAGVF